MRLFYHILSRFDRGINGRPSCTHGRASENMDRYAQSYTAGLPPEPEPGLRAIIFPVSSGRKGAAKTGVEPQLRGHGPLVQVHGFADSRNGAPLEGIAGFKRKFPGPAHPVPRPFQAERNGIKHRRPPLAVCCKVIGLSSARRGGKAAFSANTRLICRECGTSVSCRLPRPVGRTD